MVDNEFSLSQLQPFLLSHPGRGSLRVQVTAGEGSFPISRASVEVFATLGSTYLPLFRRYTNQNGVVDGMELPASPTAATQEQATAADSVTLYTVAIHHDGFAPYPPRQVEIYNNIETVLNASLTPILR